MSLVPQYLQTGDVDLGLEAGLLAGSTLIGAAIAGPGPAGAEGDAFSVFTLGTGGDTVRWVGFEVGARLF